MRIIVAGQGFQLLSIHEPGCVELTMSVCVVCICNTRMMALFRDFFRGPACSDSLV